MPVCTSQDTQEWNALPTRRSCEVATSSRGRNCARTELKVTHLSRCLHRVSSEFPLEHTRFRPAPHDHGTRSSNQPVHTQLGRRKKTEAEKGKQGSRVTSVQPLPDSEHNWTRTTEQTRPYPRSRRAPSQVGTCMPELENRKPA